MIRSRAIEELLTALKTRGQDGERVGPGEMDAESVDAVGRQRHPDHS
jgi:hypothetical protein